MRCGPLKSKSAGWKPFDFAQDKPALRNKGYLVGGFEVETMPAPSLMVRIWLGEILVKRSIFWVVGHFTSMRSMMADLPRPKWRRRSDWDMTLAPEWTSSIWA